MVVAEHMMQDETLSWKGTGMCEDLVLATQHNEVLGVMERSALKECYKWRAVANVTISMFDLWGVSDIVLLHWTNAAETIIQHVNAGAAGVNKSAVWQADAYAEEALFCIAQMDNTEVITRFMRHAYLSAVHLKNMMEIMWKNSFLSEAIRTKTRNITLPSKGNWSSKLEYIMRETSATSQFVHWSNGTHFTALATRIPNEQDESLVQNPRKHRSTGAANVPNPSLPNVTHRSKYRRNRKILQDIDGLQGGWPVVWSDVIWNFKTKESRTCDLFDIGNESVRHVINASREYFVNGYRERNYSNFSITDTLMKVPTISNERWAAEQTRVVQSQEGIVQDTVLFVIVNSTLSAIEALSGVKTKDVIAFFNPEETLQEQIDGDMFTLARIMQDLTHCNIQHIMLCDTKARALIPTILICGAGIWLVCKALWLSSGMMILVMTLLLPWFTMWYSYEYSPSCFPLVPTCLMHDVKVALDSTFPSHVQWPALLIHQDICSRDGVAINPEKRNTTNCFKSCAGDEFQFRSWIDPLAWFLCEAHIPTCRKAANWLSEQTSLMDAYAETTEYFIQVLVYNNPHYTVAHRTCAMLTGFYIIPAALFAMWVVLMSTTLITTILVLSVKTLVFAMYANSDAEQLDDEKEDVQDGDNGIQEESEDPSVQRRNALRREADEN
eukprot:2220114-Rhodomonas_salina.5